MKSHICECKEKLDSNLYEENLSFYMLNFALIFLCFLLGMGLRKLGRFPSNAGPALNAFIIHVSLPAVVLTQLPALLTQPLSLAMLAPIAMPWILFGLAFVFFRWWGNRMGWSRALIGGLTLTAGLGNTSFVGFPLLEALVGKHAIGVGVLLDQLGTFLVLSTLGLIAAVHFSAASKTAPGWKQTLKRVFQFPPFLALLVSFVWALLGYQEGNDLHKVLERLAGTLVPLALVAVGLQLHLSREILALRWKPLITGLTFKLVLAPVFFTVLYGLLFPAKSEIIHITLLEAAMAPMITAAVVANEFELDGELANLMVGLGIPLSLLTVPIWHYFILGV